MFEHQIHRERNRANHFISLGEKDGHPSYMDFTSFMINAEQADVKRGYGYEKDGVKYGPAGAIEIERALEYARYVEPFLTGENMNKFNTVQRQRTGMVFLNKKGEPVRGYSFFSDMSEKKEKETS